MLVLWLCFVSDHHESWKEYLFSSLLRSDINKIRIIISFLTATDFIHAETILSLFQQNIAVNIAYRNI